MEWKTNRMPLFIKTESFTRDTYSLSFSERKIHIEAHKQWVKNLILAGEKVASGYLVDESNTPGGGGILILKANTLEDARKIIETDPLIVAGLVEWNLQEWLQIHESPLIKYH